jgi:hypothetical protein
MHAGQKDEPLCAREHQCFVCSEQDRVFGFCHAEEQAVEGIAVRLGRLHNSQHMLVGYGQDDGSGGLNLVAKATRRDRYERDGVKHRVVELRADTIGKLDRAERRAENEVDPDASEA